MVDPRVIIPLAIRFFALFSLLFLAEPLLGAWITFRWFGRAKVGDFPYKRCSQAFLYASSATILAVFGLNFYLASHRVSPETQVAVVACAYVITQLVVVPLVLRNFAPRALLIQGGSVLAASAAAFASFYLIVA